MLASNHTNQISIFPNMSPQHSIDFCPLCGGGLCGIRICGFQREGDLAQDSRINAEFPHGLVVCDECDAIWLEPDLTTAHQYPDVENAKCPICHDALWGPNSRWANRSDLARLQWDMAINPALDLTEG